MKLKLASSNNKEPSRQEIAMAEIEQTWREYHGPNGVEWTPYNGPTTPWSEGISTSLDRGRYIVKVDAPLPWYRKVLRWLRMVGKQ